MTMQESHEYHLVQHYRARLSVAHAEKARADAALLALAAQSEVRMSDLEAATTCVFRASREVATSAALLADAEAALNEAYPADVQVLAAIEAVKAAHEQAGEIHGRLEASYTDEQNALIEAEREAESALDAAVKTAKALIEAAQVSPSKAFVVKRSEKAKASPAIIAEAGLTRFLKIDESGLAKWAAQNPDEAASVVDEIESSVSVAFYPNKL